MSVHVHVCGGDCQVGPKLDLILERLEAIMATQAEMAQSLNQLADQIDKVGRESENSLRLIEELRVQIDNLDKVSPELQAAFDRAAASVKRTDDLIPDVPPASAPAPTPGQTQKK